MGRLLYKTGKWAMILLYRLMYILLPVKKNRIVFCSGAGKSYAGNPRAVYEHMVEHGMDGTWDCIWFYEKTRYAIPGICRQVQLKRLKYLLYMATARVWIFDARQPQFIRKRKNTLYIQTWHGTPLKKLALDMDDVFMSGEDSIEKYKKNFAENVKTWDCLVSQNAFSSEIFYRAFAFRGTMLEIGYPRNDVLFKKNNERDIRQLKGRLGLPKDKKILLYAPTWRDDEFTGANGYRFLPALSFDELWGRIGKEYILIVKYHYLIMDAVDWSGYEGFIYTFDQSRDIAELYLVADALITDYSSVMFDYSILGRPMYFFAYDLEKYRDTLRGFYFDFEREAPGPISRTTGQLAEDILAGRREDYEERYAAFREKYNSRDNGTACQKICGLVTDFIERGNGYGNNSELYGRPYEAAARRICEPEGQYGERRRDDV